MSSIDELIEKYKRRDFEKVEKRTLKEGVRYLLERPKFGPKWGYKGTTYVYIYFVDGDAKGQHILDFINDYKRIREGFSVEKRDRVQVRFVASGDLDEQEFKALKNKLLDPEERKGVKAECLGEANPEDEEEVENAPPESEEHAPIPVSHRCQCGHKFKYEIPSEIIRRGASYQTVLHCPKCKKSYTLVAKPDDTGSFEVTFAPAD